MFTISLGTIHLTSITQSNRITIDSIRSIRNIPGLVIKFQVRRMEKIIQISIPHWNNQIVIYNGFIW